MKKLTSKEQSSGIPTIVAFALTVLISVVMFSAVRAGSPSGYSLSILPSYGTGRTQVKLYASYFCAPCRSLAPQVEPILADLVKKNVITLTFVDVPSSKNTMEYAGAFLRAVQGRQNIDLALAARKVLVEAAAEGVRNKFALEGYLQRKGITLMRSYDPSSAFKAYNDHMKQDRISATPTCVITDGATGRKTVLNGSQEVMDGLKRLYLRTAAN